LSFLFKNVKLEERGKNLIYMHGSIGERHAAGNPLVMTYAGRKYPGIFIKDSKDVVLDSVRLYYTAAMGIVGQTSENISLNAITAEPRRGSGRLLSVNADATHFINCRGRISVTNCKFVQMMDDASNVHGIYNPYREKHPDGSLKLGIGHPQHKGVLPYRIGDRVAVIDAASNETRAVGSVLEVSLVSPEEIRLKLDCDVPAPTGNWVTENLSTAPEVYFGNCESGYNRPRGFLISTAGKALVEKCKFYNMGQGIQISGEMKDWYESGHVEDLCIRDCDFHNSAYAGGVAILCHPALWCTDTVFNKKITVENNVFTQANKRICSIKNCEEVIFKNNKFCSDPTLPPHKMHGEDGMTFKNCLKVVKDEL
ncbi:MAG: right-handed parallel beta-helix repeat-containing protein, partial [Clostridia bacterium]|nr:right-handed parallel beta-helix repeat-containing protein [Clostridia bacterium]